METYLSIYNAAGFLMHVEIDWVHRLIWRAKHPVITIKPLAAGRLLPLVGLAFNWSTIREVDMVAVGTSTPDEAREVIEVSRAVLEASRRRGAASGDAEQADDKALDRVGGDHDDRAKQRKRSRSGSASLAAA